MITPRGATRLRDELGIPGMVVMQFGYDGPAVELHRLENHPGGASSTPARTTATPRSAGGARSPAARRAGDGPAGRRSRTGS